jgi:hypothetical protein
MDLIAQFVTVAAMVRLFSAYEIRSQARRIAKSALKYVAFNGEGCSAQSVTVGRNAA